MNENQLKKALAEVHIKEDMQQRLVDNCSLGYEKNTIERRPITMKKINKIAVIAATLAVLMIGFTTISYGQVIYEAVRGIVLGGHAQYIEADDDINIIGAIELGALPETDELIADIDAIGYVTRFTNAADAQIYLAFDLSIPTYIPAGYTFDSVELFTDENGQIDGQYASVYFTNGEKYIYLQARLMNEETGFTADLGGLQATQINGYDALIDGASLNVDIDGVVYMFSANSADVGSDELVKMVESL